MQIGSLVPHAPKLARAASSAASTPAPSHSSGDSVTLGGAFGHAVSNIYQGAAIIGGVPALGALAAQAGGLGVSVAVAGTAALGAWLGMRSDIGDSTFEKASMGAATAGLGCMIGAVAGTVGGLEAGLIVGGTFGAIGAFRGVLFTMSEHNLI